MYVKPLVAKLSLRRFWFKSLKFSFIHCKHGKMLTLCSNVNDWVTVSVTWSLKPFCWMMNFLTIVHTDSRRWTRWSLAIRFSTSKSGNVSCVPMLNEELCFPLLLWEAIFSPVSSILFLFNYWIHRSAWMIIFLEWKRYLQKYFLEIYKIFNSKSNANKLPAIYRWFFILLYVKQFAECKKLNHLWVGPPAS